MARTFDITAASDSVRLDAQGQGDAGFTVSNVSGRRLRGRARIAPKDPATGGWLTIAGDAERDFPAGGTQLFTVKVAVPAKARSGTHAFRLDVVSVDNPDEETAQGPSVAFTVAEAPPQPPKSYSLWLVLAVILVLIVAAAAIWLVLRSPASAPAPVAAASFAGDWSTNVATLTLEQNGTQVTGEYRMYGSDAPIGVAGTVNNRTLAGTLDEPARKTAFTLTLDPGNDSFHGTRGAKKPWCGQRRVPSRLPADCGVSGAWSFKTRLMTISADLAQTGEDVTGTVSGEVGLDISPTVRETEVVEGDLVDAKMRGWAIEGRLQLRERGATAAMVVPFRWTLVNEEFQQIQGTEFLFAIKGRDALTVMPGDHCGARRGSPLPTPCREPSGLVLDRFSLRSLAGTDQWDHQDNAPTRAVGISSNDFRVTVAARAATNTHVQFVGLGVRPLHTSDVWLRIGKGFSNDVKPNAIVSVQRRRQRAELLLPFIPYSGETVHFMIERRSGRFTLSCSEDGQQWTLVHRDMDFPMDEFVEAYAVAYSNQNDRPIAAEFTDLKVTIPQ